MYLYEICHASFKPDLRGNDYTNASAVSLIRWCMRIFLLSALLTFNLLLFGKDSHSQGLDQVIISLNVKDATLKQVLTKIGKQTSFHFTYRSDDVRRIKAITYTQEKVSLAKVLSDLLQNTGLRYEAIDKNILIMQTASQAAEVVPDIVADTSFVRGKVTNENGEPLVGVTVTIKGQNKTTVTNSEGEFIIPNTKPGKYTLVVTSVGYEPQNVSLSGQASVSVVLKTSNLQLNEVVVTALGIRKQAKSLGYSTTQIPGSNLTESRTPNLANALTGQIAGVSVAGTGTGPNGSTRITIRGNTSLTGGGTPLYVIDGVPIDASNQGSSGKWGGPDYGDALSTINPDDIESINVLKGVAGSALYGYRGGNGVVIITTKSGSSSKGIGVELNNNLTFNNLIDEREFQYDYGQGSNKIKPATIDAAQNTATSSWGPKIDGSTVVDVLGNSVPYVAHKDNFKDFYKTGIYNQTSVALSGKNANGNFRLGLTNTNSTEVIPNGGSTQQGVNFNSNYNFTDRLHLNFSASYMHEKVKNRPWHSDPPGSVIASSFLLASTFDIRSLSAAVDENGDEILPGGPTNIYFNNPYFRSELF
jgi:TonB-dependent SusC/RagA subfamily outer membrane receptor